MKASTTISAWTDFTRTYNGYNYKFYVVGGASGLPNDYSFNSDVIDYVIETCGKAQRYQIENRSDIVVVDWAQQTTENIMNWVFGAVVNAYTATGSLLHDYVNSSAITYSWDFSFTGSDDSYPGWDTYGTAYGFTFKGACADTIDLVLDSQGNFYGHNPLGNYTIDSDPEPYNWILINQGLDNFYIPTSNFGNFNNLEQPYIDGKSLHFFVYDSSNEKHEVIIPDFTETNIIIPGLEPFYFDLIVTSLNNNSRSTLLFDNISYNGSAVTVDNYQTLHTGYYSRLTGYRFRLPTNVINRSNCSVNYPSNYNLNWNNSIFRIYNPNGLGLYQGSLVSGSGDIWLKGFSYTPNINPNSIPEDPIPITSIPEDPEDPIPQSNPDPVPGITYPEPTPPPLPPFASIVSGNDELWGVTLDFDGAQNSLLPYLNSLATFEFPSFNDLINDFSASIIWVAQIMSVLYNGTSFNVLFIVLCLFSLVSIIIGGYKLWTTTEPDPNNPGFRRTKRPPKGPKGRRRR